MPPKALERNPSKNHKIQREELKIFFREHDLDGDGRLSIHELTRAFGALGAFIPLYTASHARHIADANGDGFIDEAELDKLIDYAEKCNYDLI